MVKDSEVLSWIGANKSQSGKEAFILHQVFNMTACHWIKCGLGTYLNCKSPYKTGPTMAKGCSSLTQLGASSSIISYDLVWNLLWRFQSALPSGLKGAPHKGILACMLYIWLYVQYYHRAMVVAVGSGMRPVGWHWGHGYSYCQYCCTAGRHCRLPYKAVGLALRP